MIGNLYLFNEGDPLTGGIALFGDIDPETYNLDPDTAREVIEERDDIAAIMSVHLY